MVLPHTHVLVQSFAKTDPRLARIIKSRPKSTSLFTVDMYEDKIVSYVPDGEEERFSRS
jgi:hypothetical protein